MRSTDEFKKKAKEYKSDPDNKKRAKELNQRPEAVLLNRERQKKYRLNMTTEEREARAEKKRLYRASKEFIEANAKYLSDPKVIKRRSELAIEYYRNCGGAEKQRAYRKKKRDAESDEERDARFKKQNEYSNKRNLDPERRKANNKRVSDYYHKNREQVNKRSMERYHENKKRIRDEKSKHD